MTIIDGKKVSQKILNEVKERHEILKQKNDRTAGLAVIIVGDNPASQVYVRNKIKSCENIGFYSETVRLDASITEDELIAEVEKLNKNDNIDGILVQLPLPEHINALKVINTICPEKDVDGFNIVNVGKMFIGDKTAFLPCTPHGVLKLLDEYDINVEGMDVVIVGRSNIAGKPMAFLLLDRGATVQICHLRTKNLSEKLKNADMIVVAAGQPKLIKEKDVKKDVIIIDIGINRVDGKICGDADFEGIGEKASYMTPVPGGVGPVTIAMLMKNTLQSYENTINKQK